MGIDDNKQSKTKSHPAFEVENITFVRSFLLKHNIEIKEEIPIPGQNRLSFFDPFGNRIEFLEIIE